MSENDIPQSLKRSSPMSFSPHKKRAALIPFSECNTHQIKEKRQEESAIRSPNPAPQRFYRIRYVKCFNMAFEYVNKYNVCQVLDRGVFPRDWTSHRLLQETIYFDDASDRYELKRYAQDDPHYRKNENYCLSLVRPNFIFDSSTMQHVHIPFDDEMVIPLRDHISW
ncbi:histone deacetylation protein [Blastocystis sp. subtype 4]|uniref:histone deacetylation protein n=1 Tax=Blastocystis sp. subtype 4 TaxID=944170 RepID=UPI0007118520|nr:histone deacetylation protein [Blastocystis sp. subtype 4]KNB45154.1 histone deacetylation protein [Blastocystis sp. subtype 4]|eukprot:XP_014528597.1 histone deacetylation protein [Blastocystis sp. subtype 4]